MPYVYILYSDKLDKYCAGSTVDVQARLSGITITEKFTSIGVPWQLVYSETYDLENEARKRELEITKKKSRKYIEWLIRKKEK